MTVTKTQAQMLATLAIACRPNRAPTWDEAGVLANIAKVRDRSLAEVALAVIRAAADRDAASPGVIPTAGSHWSEQLKPARWEPDHTSAVDRCSVCSHHRDKCRTLWANDHHFEADTHRPTGTDVPATIEALRAQLVEAKAAPVEDELVVEHAPNPHADAARAAMHPDTEESR